MLCFVENCWLSRPRTRRRTGARRGGKASLGVLPKMLQAEVDLVDPAWRAAMVSAIWERTVCRALFGASGRLSVLAPQTSDKRTATAPHPKMRDPYGPATALRGVQHTGSTTWFSAKVGTNPITRCNAFSNRRAPFDFGTKLPAGTLVVICY